MLQINLIRTVPDRQLPHLPCCRTIAQNGSRAIWASRRRAPPRIPALTATPTMSRPSVGPAVPAHRRRRLRGLPRRRRRTGSASTPSTTTRPRTPRNLAAGLYPTETRGAGELLGLSCHFGDEHEVRHPPPDGRRPPAPLVRARHLHPIEPAHFAVTTTTASASASQRRQDLGDRAGMALAQTLDAVLNPQLAATGLFPELVLFDCHACHQPDEPAGRLAAEQREPGLGRGRALQRCQPGHAAAGRPEVSNRNWARSSRAAGARSSCEASDGPEREWIAAAKGLREATLEAADLRAATSSARRTCARSSMRLCPGGRARRVRDYVAAEQTTMAMGTILTAMKATRLPSVRAEHGPRQEAVWRGLYAAVAQDEQYRPTAHLAVLRRLQAVAR